MLKALLAVLCLLFIAPALRAAPRREPPLLLGGPRDRTRKIVPVDPRLPTGARLGAAERPTEHDKSCSPRRPVCVHFRADQSGEVANVLAELEWAYERVVLALALKAPISDWGEGGSDALDVYLGSSDVELVVEAGPLAQGAFTQAPAFCRFSSAHRSLLRRNATLCIGEAVALALDASEPPHVRRAFATALWWGIGAPTSLDFEAIDDVQASPEQPIVTRERTALSEGAAMFFSYLEEARSSGEPFQLSAALLALAASDPAEAELTYRNEPDVFDVLRHSLEEDSARFGALMVDFAISRAFVGHRDDGQHLPALAWSGAFGRVRFDWLIPFSSLPRRVSVRPPVDSTGAALIWVDLDEVPIGAALAVRLEWEAPVTFQWQLVKVAGSGEEIGRVDVPYQERGREAEARLTRLDGARAVLIVGTNLEGIAIAHPFDPDIAPFEPHGVSVYLVRL